MLTCLPASFCSSDYCIPNAAGGGASLKFNFFTEEGRMFFAQEGYVIEKQGALSGKWRLTTGGREIAGAIKPNPLFRVLEIRFIESCYRLASPSPVTRVFDLSTGTSRVGRISPVHPFTRRAVIDCTPEVPEVVQLFSFWLVALMWRRRLRDGGSGAT